MTKLSRAKRKIVTARSRKVAAASRIHESVRAAIFDVHRKALARAYGALMPAGVLMSFGLDNVKRYWR